MIRSGARVISCASGKAGLLAVRAASVRHLPITSLQCAQSSSTAFSNNSSDCDVGGWTSSNARRYNGDGAFLQSATERTNNLWSTCREFLQMESQKQVLDLDPNVPSSITSHEPGYIDQDGNDSLIVGLQTDAPLKRSIKPFGGWGLVKRALASYGRTPPSSLDYTFSRLRKTHNDGVFDVYTDSMKAMRKNGILTGLPDNYGRGRIIGDYRRVALYGVDQLIEWKKSDKSRLTGTMTSELMQLREEVSEQIKALQELKEMAKSYGYDISGKANNAREAVQWTYFAYLAAVKEQDGAAMSLGRVDAFFDVFIERDIEEGVLTEKEAQELIDDFVIKLRLVRHLRVPEFDALFSGDPTWVTAVIGGCDEAGSSLVTKTSYRMLQTLYNLGPSPEPNLTVLWSPALPEAFKNFASQVSIDTSSIQYENDDCMRTNFGSDYGIACCVSAMKIGKDMQFFGARTNLAKLLLYSLNNGQDEITGAQVAPRLGGVEAGKPLEINDVLSRYEQYMNWLAEEYVNVMNVIHWSHDKFSYERIQMALHDTNLRSRFMAFGVAGLSVVADSLSAIKHATVIPIADDRGIIVDFKVDGDFPKFGNDDDDADTFAVEVTDKFSQYLRKYPAYRGAQHTLSVLTITSNVVYGKNTGNTPDGRIKGEAFAPGANPMHGRDTQGAIASLNSVGKINYDSCMDGISNTFSVVPHALGKHSAAQQSNLSTLLDGYFTQGGQHLNVNVLDRSMLLDAMEHPEKYPTLTLRVSGYAVRFTRLTREQQEEVLSRTFHVTL